MRVRAALITLCCACGTAAGTDVEPPRSEPAPATASLTEKWDNLFSEPEEYRAKEVSAEAGREYFTETGVGDPYGAGIPYPAFLALLATYPDTLGPNWNGFNDRFGTFFDPEVKRRVPVGFHLATDPNTGVEFLMINCQICHASKLELPGGPKVVTGMGNKRVRLHAYGKALMDIGRDEGLDSKRLHVMSDQIARAEQLKWPHQYSAGLIGATLRGLRKRAAARGAFTDAIGAELPGRVATISGFIMALNEVYDAGLELPPVRGWVKIPDVATWRYRETNSFDGVAIGAPVAQIAGADFAFGVRPKWYREHRHISTSMFLFLRSFDRDLRYPGDIDEDLADRGHALFKRKCSGCHGTYKAPGDAIRVVGYTEQLIRQEKVGTDPARINAVTPEFVAAANAIRETSGLTLVRQTRSYVPRPLVDVWARGLYGHAGQWPSIAVLATPPADRPKRFAIDIDAPYDLKNVGTRWRALKPNEAPRKGEYAYDASVPGFDVGGHEFLSSSKPDERKAIIEYLKTL